VLRKENGAEPVQPTTDDPSDASSTM
jgi:hypothetical protein